MKAHFIAGNEFVRFVLVGICTTLIHYLILRLLYVELAVQLTAAIVIAFVFAVLFSYLASYKFTFRSTNKHSYSLPRFFITTIIGLSINLLALKFLLNNYDITLEVAFLMVTALVMTSNFILSKLWVFQQRQ